jgi:hypothetical protein
MACFSESQLSKLSGTRFSWQVTRLKRATEKQRMQNIRRRAGQRNNFLAMIYFLLGVSLSHGKAAES